MRLSFIDSDLLHNGVTNKIDRHDIIEILLKVALKSITPNLLRQVWSQTRTIWVAIYDRNT